MGKGDKTTSARSAKATEMLSKSGGGGNQSGFGGFSGATPVAAGGFTFGAKYIAQVSGTQPEENASPSPATASVASAVVPQDLDGELSQHLQRLTKRDATTRLKALQALRSMIPEKPSSEVLCMLSHWAYVFGRLIMDASRAVRAEACGVMGVIALAAGRSVAPFVCSLFPYWFLAQHDDQPEVAAAATASLTAAFPGERATDALLFCKSEVLKLLNDNARSTPQSLGDPRKESPEDLQARHERVLSATCAALGAVIQQAKVPGGTDKSASSRTELLTGARALLESSAFTKSTMASKAPRVRRSGYALVTAVCRTAPELLDGPALGAIAPLTLGALGDKDPGNHAAMWDAVLSLTSKCPAAWDHVNLPKAVLPRLWSLLRHGCYGSAEASFPAVLPLVALLPLQALGLGGLQSLLRSTWEHAAACAPGAAQQAAADCFQECFVFAVLKADALAAGDGSGATTPQSIGGALAGDTLKSTVLGAAVGSDAAAVGGQVALAQGVVVGIARRLAERSDVAVQWRVDLLMDAVGSAASEALEASAFSEACPVVGDLLLALKRAVPEDSARRAAWPVLTVLLPQVRSSGSAPPAATALLALLVKMHPGMEGGEAGTGGAGEGASSSCSVQRDVQHGASFTVDSVLKRIVAEKQGGAALDASCDLIVSCLAQGADPSGQLATVVAELVSSVGASAAASLALHLVRSSDDALVSRYRSQQLDAVAVASCCEPEQPGASKLAETLLVGSGAASLLTPSGQSVCIKELTRVIESSEEDAAREAALRAVYRAVLSPALSDADVAVERLGAVAAAFEVLVEEACAAAVVSAQHGGEDEEDGHQSSELHRISLAVFTPPERIAPFVAVAPPGQQHTFVESTVASVSGGLAAFAAEGHPGATAAAAACTQAALAALGGNAPLRQDLLSGIHAARKAPAFFMRLGQDIGFDVLLSGFGDTDGPEIAAELLLAAAGEEEEDDPLFSGVNQLSTHLAASPELLSSVLDYAWAHDSTPVAARLLQAALRSEKRAAAKAAAKFFNDNLALIPANLTQVQAVLATAAADLRRDEELLSSSGLSGLTRTLCDEAAAADASPDAVLAAAACFPAAEMPPPIPAAFETPLGAGAAVWYRTTNGSWEEAEVTGADLNLVPPSYSVRLTSGVRETERSRLREREPGASAPLPQHHRSVVDAAGALHCSEAEKEALLGLFRACAGGLRPQQEHAAVLRSAVSWCWRAFTSADWRSCLEMLQTAIQDVSQAAASAATTIAAQISAEGDKVAGAALCGPLASLAFFRRLEHKGVLSRTEKGAAAAATIAQSVAVEVSGLQTSSGAALIDLLHAYCHVAQLAPSARSLPFMDWEQAQAVVCASALDIFISVGKATALAVACGQQVALTAALAHPCWTRLSEVVSATVVAADRQFLSAVVLRANAKTEADGITCTEALVAMALTPGTPAAPRDAAYRSILLHPEIVADLRKPAAGDADDEALLAESSSTADAQEELEGARVLPDLASCLASAAHPSHLAAWGLLAAHLLSAPDSSPSRAALVTRIKDVPALAQGALDAVMNLLPLHLGGTPSQQQQQRRGSVGGSEPQPVISADDTSGRMFCQRLCSLGLPLEEERPAVARSHAALLYAGLLRALPVSSRLWFGGLRDKATAAAVERYTSGTVSPGLLAAEYAAVAEMAAGLDRFEKFSVRAKPGSREVVATMEVEDGHMLELAVRLPASLPLRPPEAVCRRSVGVTEARLRKWLLSITAFLMANGATAEALHLWKRNVDNEFEGHEDCLICYSIIQPSTGQLPRLACRTCRKRFHGACLYKWFHSSGKSNCPHCQSPW